MNKGYNTIIIDGNAMMHRAFYGVSELTKAGTNEPIHMLYGFMKMVFLVIRTYNPKYLICCFDRKEKTFRHIMTDDYKGKRAAAPDSFYTQIPYVRDFLVRACIFSSDKAGFEADDLIGTYATHYQKYGSTAIISHDLDFLQLINNDIKVLRPQKNDVFEELDDAYIMDRYGVFAHQFRDYKALVGDSSDNYKGIPGIGKQAAKVLLQRYNTLTDMYNAINTVDDKYKNKLIEHKKQLDDCVYLATIDTAVTDIEYPSELQFDRLAVEDMCYEYGLKSLLRLIPKDINTDTTAVQESLF